MQTSPCRLPDVIVQPPLGLLKGDLQYCIKLDPGYCYFHLDLLTYGRRESGCQNQPSGSRDEGEIDLTMKRQFVNLVVGSCKNDSFTMHRIKSSSLFHPKKQKGPPTSLVEAELPKPSSTFVLDGGEVMFMPFGSSRDKIISADQDGTVLVHDICHNKLSSMRRHRGLSSRSVAITLDEDLYIINRCPHEPRHLQLYKPCSQALIQGEPPGWYWHYLPLPPYATTPWYEPSCTTKIDSSAVIRDSIWVSARGGIGTYSFHKRSREWSKVGSWEIPFRGHAQYVPELDRWIGFSPGRENQFLCASDLMVAAAAYEAVVPTLSHVWKEDIATNPQDWELLSSYLVRVDSGRFCIARLFCVFDEHPFIKEEFAVFTGVELGRSDAGIQMVKHKSIRYNFHDKQLRLVC